MNDINNLTYNVYHSPSPAPEAEEPRSPSYIIENNALVKHKISDQNEKKGSIAWHRPLSSSFKANAVYDHKSKDNDIRTKLKKHNKEPHSISKQFICYSFPSIIYLILMSSINLISLHFVGRDTTENSAYLIDAVGGCFTILNCTTVGLIISLNYGLVSITSQAFGAKNYKLIGLYLHRALLINSLVLIISFIALFFIDKIILLLNAPPETAKQAKNLVICLYFGLICFMLFDTLKNYLMAQNIFYPQVIVQIFTITGHCLWCYLFIERLNLGIIGVAISYNITYILAVSLLFSYVIISKKLNLLDLRNTTNYDNNYQDDLIFNPLKDQGKTNDPLLDNNALLSGDDNYNEYNIKEFSPNIKDEIDYDNIEVENNGLIKSKVNINESWYWFTKKSFQIKSIWYQIKAEVEIGSMVFLELAAYEIVTMLAASYNAEEMAAQVSFYNIACLLYYIPDGIGLTLNALAGKSIGENSYKKTSKYLTIAVWCNIAVIIVSSTILFVFREQLARFFSDDPEVINQIKHLCILYVVIFPADSFQCVMSGYIRAIGKERVGSLSFIFFLYLIGLPVAYILGDVLGYHIFGLWAGMGIGVLCLFLIDLLIIIMTNLKDQSTKIQMRLAEHNKTLLIIK